MGDLHNMYVLGGGEPSHPNYRAHPLTHAQDKPTKPDTGLEKQLARRFVTQNYQLAVSSSQGVINWRGQRQLHLVIAAPCFIRELRWIVRVNCW
jgi:hypothetical protein